MAVKFEKGTAIATLSLTPLIDVVFLLLIFFLVATRFEQEERELDVLLPQASAAKPLITQPTELFVNVSADGSKTKHIAEVMNMCNRANIRNCSLAAE